MNLNLPALARSKGQRVAKTLRPIIPATANAQSLAMIYLDVVRIWEEAAGMIIAGYSPPTLDALTTDTPAESQQAIDAAADHITQLVLTISARMRSWAVMVERWHRSKWASTVYAATNVDLSTVLTAQPVEQTIEATIAQNVALIRDVSAQVQQKISGSVFRGYQNRTPAREIAKEIREATGFARDRSLRIASDQNSKISAALDTERMAEAGLDLWKYRHSGKLHPRSWHRVRDGRIYTVRGDKQVNADGTPMAGGDVIAAGDGPGQPPFCGCRKQGYLPIMAELERENA